MKMKYIMCYMEGVDNTPVIFPEYVGHDDMQRKLHLDREEITSAGFVTIDIVDNEPVAKCYGNSTSLNLSSNEKDSARVTKYFRGY